MSKKRNIEEKTEDVQRVNSAETSAISIMRSLPPDQRQDAFEWFKTLAADRGIREHVLKILESYVADSTKK